MDIMGFMVDLSTDGAMPVPCKLEMKQSNLVITLTELAIQLVIPIDAIQIVSADELHG